MEKIQTFKKVKTENVFIESLLNDIDKGNFDINQYIQEIIDYEIINIDEEAFRIDFSKSFNDFFKSISENVLDLIKNKDGISVNNDFIVNLNDEKEAKEYIRNYIFNNFFKIKNLKHKKIEEFESEEKYKRFVEEFEFTKNEYLSFVDFKKQIDFNLLEGVNDLIKIPSEHYIKEFNKILKIEVEKIRKKSQNKKSNYDAIEYKKTTSTIRDVLDTSIFMDKDKILQSGLIKNQEKEEIKKILAQKIKNQEELNEVFRIIEENNFIELLHNEFKDISFLEKIEIHRGSGADKVDLANVYLFIKDIKTLNLKLPLNSITLKIRKLGKHNANGLYLNGFKILAIDVDSPNSFIHELFHAIHYSIEKMAEEGNEMAIEANELIKEVGRVFKRRVTNSGIASIDNKMKYYKNFEEIIARSGEVGYLLNMDDLNKTNVSLVSSEEEYRKYNSIYFDIINLMDKPEENQQEIKLLSDFSTFLLKTDFGEMDEKIINEIKNTIKMLKLQFELIRNTRREKERGIKSVERKQALILHKKEENQSLSLSFEELKMIYKELDLEIEKEMHKFVDLIIKTIYIKFNGTGYSYNERFIKNYSINVIKQIFNFLKEEKLSKEIGFKLLLSLNESYFFRNNVGISDFITTNKNMFFSSFDLSKEDAYNFLFKEDVSFLVSIIYNLGVNNLFNARVDIPELIKEDKISKENLKILIKTLFSNEKIKHNRINSLIFENDVCLTNVAKHLKIEDLEELFESEKDLKDSLYFKLIYDKITKNQTKDKKIERENMIEEIRASKDKEIMVVNGEVLINITNQDRESEINKIIKAKIASLNSNKEGGCTLFLVSDAKSGERYEFLKLNVFVEKVKEVILLANGLNKEEFLRVLDSIEDEIKMSKEVSQYIKPKKIKKMTPSFGGWI